MPAVQNMTVLVVDDQQSMRQLTRFTLEKIGIRKIAQARDGFGALEAMQKFRFDLVISDWNMDGMDGIQLLKTIRSDPLQKRTPFIMATGQNSKEQVREAIAAGVNNYVVKPFSAKILRDKIEAVMGPLQ